MERKATIVCGLEKDTRGLKETEVHSDYEAANEDELCFSIVVIIIDVFGLFSGYWNYGNVNNQHVH